MVHSAAWNAIRAERSADTQCPENFVVPNIPHRTNNKENESDYDLKSGALEGLPSLCCLLYTSDAADEATIV